MDFQSAQIVANLLAKPFARDILKLLVNYRDLSASEAASRLDLHIKTAQDFLDELVTFEIAGKTEVFERKRPYYRYKLIKLQFSIDIDLAELADVTTGADERLTLTIREIKNAPAAFTIARSGDRLSSVTVFIGVGRDKKERKISLTLAQGKFLYYLPFPTAAPLPVAAIMEQAGVQSNTHREVFDILKVLIDYEVIDVVK
jgi:hypothetical protein